MEVYEFAGSLAKEMRQETCTGGTFHMLMHWTGASFTLISIVVAQVAWMGISTTCDGKFKADKKVVLGEGGSKI